MASLCFLSVSSRMIYVTNGMFCMNLTTSVPKSVLRYSVDKVRQGSESEVWYSNASYVQN